MSHPPLIGTVAKVDALWEAGCDCRHKESVLSLMAQVLIAEAFCRQASEIPRKVGDDSTIEAIATDPGAGKETGTGASTASGLRPDRRLVPFA
jgi:hypothetical protein